MIYALQKYELKKLRICAIYSLETSKIKGKEYWFGHRV